MIRCLLIRNERGPNDLPIRHEEWVFGDPIEIGRGHACGIHVADESLLLCHASIRRQADGTLTIEGEHGALLNAGGSIEQVARLAPGQKVVIGSCRITVGDPRADADLVIFLEPASRAPDKTSGADVAGLPLADPTIAKGRIGMILAAAIVLLFVVAPLLPRVSVKVDEWQASLPVTLTDAWRPGPVSSGHAGFGHRCSVCHQRAFSAVADSACRECHRRQPAHLPSDSEKRIDAEALRCVDCHAGHESKAEFLRTRASPCVDCHGRLESEISRIRDFSATHPSFQLAVPHGRAVRRVRQSADTVLSEDSGLKFSHKAHLKDGGISTPLGDTRLECVDCHRLAPDGESFAAIEMEMTCQQSNCHRIRFSGPLRQLVPHGSERVPIVMLRDAYARELADDAQARRACGPGREVSSFRLLLDCADAMARDNARSTLFRREGESLECGLCHVLAAGRQGEDTWKVAAVQTRHDWQPKARFAHDRHATVACAECHVKSDATRSADVAFPRIEKCRECHADTPGTRGKVASACAACHRFHRSETVGLGKNP